MKQSGSEDEWNEVVGSCHGRNDTPRTEKGVIMAGMDPALCMF